MTDDADSPVAVSGRRFQIAIFSIVAATVLILNLPTPAGLSVEAHRLIGVTFLMAALWATQVVPLAATSLIPLAAFPLFGIMEPKAVSKSYVSDTLFLYLGGMIIALGIERWQLHRRLALNLVAVAGVSPRRLIFGFLLSTAILSMWISNTACTLLMLPIATAMLKTLDDLNRDQSRKRDAGSPLFPTERIAVPLLLSIAYGASIGGMMTQVGSPTNSSAMGIYRDMFEADRDISMSQWMMACFPIGLIYLLLTWIVLAFRLPGASHGDIAVRGILRGKLSELGRPDSAEIRMLIIFLLTGLLWVFRLPIQVTDSITIPGWLPEFTRAFNAVSPWYNSSEAKLSSGDVVSDSTIAMSIAILLFFIPSGHSDPQGRSVPLMTWNTASRLPWDMILLFGGGFALADAFEATKLSQWLGTTLQQPLAGQPVWVVIAALCLMMTFLTEFTSNVATVNTVMPTILTMAAPLGIDPRLLFVPVTLAASCAFMLPIGTPPNAIVFSTGRVPPTHMAAYGLILNLIGIPILTLGAIWILKPVFGIP
ncbi:MAG: SLC13/DASS family transporter [Planctomyces sp.]|nr:SLC13/DASS family transporter [Planctomyces sp.]